MDFGTLLQTAKQNEQGSKKDVRYYSTKFAAPKKEKKDKTLSANIQKFLARKEAEEREKAHEASKKREELLALRSKDKKATRRVNVMLKRTKSANQSVIEDAVDKDNTAVTLAGPSQPDEDDYGYVSQEAAAFYNKMMEKYNKMPDDPKFAASKRKASSNLSNTKDRVRAALEREKEEAMLPHRRKRRHKEGEQITQYTERDDDGYRDEPPIKAKPKPGGAPPINFSDLLKLAEQKQHEPIVIEVKPKEEEGPLMTKKQKREQERQQQRKPKDQNTPQLAKISKLSSAQTDGKPRDSGRSESAVNNRISYSNESQKEGSKNLNQRPKNDEKMSKPNGYNGSSMKTKPSAVALQTMKVDNDHISSNRERELTSIKTNRESQNLRNGDKHANLIKSQKSLAKHESIPNRGATLNSSNKNGPSNNGIRKTFENKPVTSKISEKRPLNPKDVYETSSKPITKSAPSAESFKRDLKLNGNTKAIEKSKQNFGAMKSREFPPRDIQPKRFPPDDLRPKQLPLKDLKPKQFPPADVRPRQFPPRDLKRKPLPNKRRIIDDDEYDSEMDDFIDDGPTEGEDYSKYIKDIFGYDKNKYRAVDEDDVDNMESTFAQQMREDVRSTKIGIMEDLEDIKREKEEKRRKAVMKKRR